MVQVGFIQWDADEMRKTAFISLQRTLSMSPIFLHPSRSPVSGLSGGTTTAYRPPYWGTGEGQAGSIFLTLNQRTMGFRLQGPELP